MGFSVDRKSKVSLGSVVNKFKHQRVLYPLELGRQLRHLLPRNPHRWLVLKRRVRLQALGSHHDIALFPLPKDLRFFEDSVKDEGSFGKLSELCRVAPALLSLLLGTFDLHFDLKEPREYVSHFGFVWFVA